MHTGVIALCLEGYALDDIPVKRGLQAIERFSWSDKRGKRVQACVSPVWDTILSTIGLCDANMVSDHTARAMKWVKDRQLCGPEGDWRVYKPNITAGGFSFEYFNRWYPDVDDTAAAILAMIKQDPELADSRASIVKAVQWIIGMQNNDGGWGAFDIHNDRLFLNKIPFSDMEALCDPSTADVTGRILEAFGLLFQRPHNLPFDLINDMKLACDLAIHYLLITQEQNGSWYGRWGANYIYGTSNVVCGLALFSAWEAETSHVGNSLDRAISWLRNVQNPDGGWGETLLSYRKPELGGQGSSTASQTGWALMALLARSSSHQKSIQIGVGYLLRTQTLSDRPGEASWPESQYTGTGFPNHFYLGYSLYSHYFPMMALGRYARLS
jgi:squalene-hopene/tetraprenyl-beta-curcumene cyclase